MLSRFAKNTIIAPKLKALIYHYDSSMTLHAGATSLADIRAILFDALHDAGVIFIAVGPMLGLPAYLGH